MLFAAGMGIGLMYFGVAESMQHYSSEVFGIVHYVNKAKMLNFILFSIGEFTLGQFMQL